MTVVLTGADGVVSILVEEGASAVILEVGVVSVSGMEGDGSDSVVSGILSVIVSSSS